MLQQIFASVLAISIRASVLILFIAVIREITRRRYNRVMCLLWGLVALRLLCPLTLHLGLSVPSVFSESIDMAVGNEDNTHRSERISSEEEFPINAITDADESVDEKKAEISVATSRVIMRVATDVWLFGMLLFLVYNLLVTLRYRRRLAEGVMEKGVLFCDNINVPFVFGLFHARICVPSDINPDCLNDIIAHEKNHIVHSDNLRMFLYTCVLAIHWFNPLVWLAFMLFGRDLELTCDDSVLRKMDQKAREHYLTSVLSCSRRQRERTVYSVDFAGGGLKERMNNIMTEKKCSKPVIVLLLLTTIVVGVATLLGVKNEKALAKESEGVSTKDIVYDSTAVNRDELRTGRLSKYFEYPGDEGFIVFVFEDAKDEFRFGLRTGSDIVHWSQQEISEIARERCNLEEMKAILSTYDVPKDKVRCLLTFNPSSSYLGGELSAHRDSLETEEFLKRMIFGSNE